MTRAAREEIQQAARVGTLFISPISAWEIGMAAKRGRVELDLPTEAWVQRVFSRPDLQTAAVAPEIAIRACFLPGEFHAGPADRLIAATATELGLKLITRDERILNYGRRGYLPVMAC